MFRYAGVAEWQTHLTQNQAGNTVWVQVPPPPTGLLRHTDEDERQGNAPDR